MTASTFDANKVYDLPIAEITLKEAYQPRVSIDEEKINELATSIRKSGLHEPILFKIEDDKIVLVAGHRRYRAVKDNLKLDTIRGILTEGEPEEIALIENVVRVDLTPLEEAKAYKKLIDTKNYKQKDISEITGKAESTISETLSIVEKIKPKLLELIEKDNASCPRWVLLQVAKETTKKQTSIYKRLNAKGLTREEFKKGTTKTSPNMPVYIAAQVAKKLGSFDYSNLQDKTREKFVQSIKELHAQTTRILVDLGVTETE